MEMTAFQRRVAVAVAGLAAVTAMSASVASPASAQESWGSIAASHHLGDQGYPQTGGVKNATTKADAEAQAISACGQSDCAMFIDFQDCGIAAFDADNKQLVGGRGATLQAAKDDATAKLKPGASAKIMIQGCNKGYGT